MNFNKATVSLNMAEIKQAIKDAVKAQGWVPGVVTLEFRQGQRDETYVSATVEVESETKQVYKRVDPVSTSFVRD